MSFSRKDLTMIKGDARVCHRELQRLLGYKDDRYIVRIISRHLDELESYSELTRTSDAKGGIGRPRVDYFLTEHQALLVCLMSRTEKARQVREELIRAFIAWRRGEIEALKAAAQRPAIDPFRATRERVLQVADTNNGLIDLQTTEEFARNVANMPIWVNGRRPAWWKHLDIREFLIASHRQMSILDCEAEVTRRFGNRGPKKSAIGDFWLKLDKVLGPVKLTDAA